MPMFCFRSYLTFLDNRGLPGCSVRPWRRVSALRGWVPDRRMVDWEVSNRRMPDQGMALCWREHFFQAGTRLLQLLLSLAVQSSVSSGWEDLLKGQLPIERVSPLIESSLKITLLVRMLERIWGLFVGRRYVFLFLILNIFGKINWTM